MAEKIRLDLARIEKHYRIEADGAVWSYRLGRYLKPTFSGGYYQYYYVSLRDAGIGYVSVHRLVAEKYIGVCPDRIRHKDGNRYNNHWSNLGYITHTEIMHIAYAQGKKSVGSFVLPSWEAKGVLEGTRKKMVISSAGDIWDSVNECAKALGYTREGIGYAMRRGIRMKNGLKLEFYEP
jgi:hypothetical protein